jgi:integrase
MGNKTNYSDWGQTTINERIKYIVDYFFKGNTTQMAKAVFVKQSTLYLCGINLADLVEIKEIKNGRIEYHRRKTNKLYSIKVEPEAMEIINRNKGNEYLLNIKEIYSDYRSFNSKLNNMQKKFGPVEVVNKKGKKTCTQMFPNISIYWARHSWASVAAEIGISDEVISQALGHSTTNPTTAIYINRNRDKIDEANRKVIDFINSYEEK